MPSTISASTASAEAGLASATWVWLGDHLALDVANTSFWPDADTRLDLWRTPADLFAWLDAEPAPLPRPASVSEAEWARLRRTRDHVVALLDAADRRVPLPGASVAAVNDAVRAGRAVRVLASPGSGGASVGVETGAADAVLALRGHLAAAVVDLLARDDLANLARCRAPDCGQFFHRGRPNQRWCSPGCGNRARVDRHRHRRAATNLETTQENS